MKIKIVGLALALLLTTVSA